MERDITALKEKKFDVLIIGGGIHGSTAALEFVTQGLNVALIEEKDFGSMTSANSLKIIHGGFRYLQHLNIKRMRESVQSRRLMFLVSPPNVKPLCCVIPTEGLGLRNPHVMRLGLFINDIIGFDKNRNIDISKMIPSGKIMSLKDCEKHFSTVRWDGYTGGAAWYDALAVNSERLTLDFVKTAAERGAEVVNYCSLKKFIIDDDRVIGAHVEDQITKEMFKVSTKTVVVTGGANNEAILNDFRKQESEKNEWALAVNIIIKKKLLKDSAIGLTGEDEYEDNDAILKKKGRFFFFVPWRGYTMIGTTYRFCTNSESELQPKRSDIETILTEVNALFPEEKIKLSDVTKVHTGLVPAYSVEQNSEVQLVKETEIDDLSDISNVSGLFAVKSVKYTTAPVVSQHAAKIVTKYLKRKFYPNCVEKSMVNNSLKLLEKGESILYAQLVDKYGKWAKMVLPYAETDSSVISEEPPLVAGEIDYFVKEEMAQTLEDVVMRRSDCGSAECPSKKILEKIGSRMAMILGWSDKRLTEEIDTILQREHWS